MKEWDEIQRLLDRYYEGTATPEEEQRLRTCFRTKEVPPELTADRELFLRLSSMREEAEVPAGLEKRISARIDGWEREEQSVQPESRNPVHRRVFLRRTMAVAAGLALLIAAGTYVYRTADTYARPADTYASPQEAYAEAQKALLLFSRSLNKGLAQVEKAETATGKVRNAVDKYVNNSNNQ